MIGLLAVSIPANKLLDSTGTRPEHNTWLRREDDDVRQRYICFWAALDNKGIGVFVPGRRWVANGL